MRSARDANRMNRPPRELRPGFGRAAVRTARRHGPALPTLAAGGAALFVAAAGVVGCARKQPPKPDVTVDPLITTDAAMTKRPWSPSPAQYPNGAVVAGPTEFNYQPKPDQAPYAYYAADTFTYLLNMGLLPYYLVVTPPWTEATYPGAVIPPTYSGMAPTPPSSDAKVVRSEMALPSHPPGRPVVPPPSQASPATAPARSSTPRVTVTTTPAPATAAPAPGLAPASPRSATPHVQVLTPPSTRPARP